MKLRLGAISMPFQRGLFKFSEIAFVSKGSMCHAIAWRMIIYKVQMHIQRSIVEVGMGD